MWVGDRVTLAELNAALPNFFVVGEEEGEEENKNENLH